MRAWEKHRLGDIAEIIDCPHSTPKWTSEGIFAVRNFNLSNGRIVKEKVSYVSRKTFEERTKRAMPQKGDCILSREAPIGSVGYLSTDEQICLGQRVVLIHPLDTIDNRFLLYQLISAAVQKQFKQSNGTGSTVSNLRIPLIKSTLVSLPDKNTQTRIASILSAYDDLIENNEKRIKILEEMAQRLYQEWFVKFKFPGHEKVRFVDSETEYGKIPDGWEVKRLGDEIQIKKGKNITRDTIVDGDVPVVAGGLEPAYFHNIPNTKGPVVTVSASGANAGFTRLYFQNIWASDCSYIDTNLNEHVYFFYLFLKNKQEEISQLQRGSAQPHVYPKDLMELQLVHAPTKIMENFSENISPIFDLVGKLKYKNNNLSKIRDLFIPQIVTGKREVKYDL